MVHAFSRFSGKSANMAWNACFCRVFLPPKLHSQNLLTNFMSGVCCLLFFSADVNPLVVFLLDAVGNFYFVWLYNHDCTVHIPASNFASPVHTVVSTFDGAIKLDDVLSKRVKGVVDIHQQETVTTTSALCMDVHWAFRHLDLLQSQSLETNYRVIRLCLWESCRVFSDFGNFDRFSQGNVTLIANRATSGTSPTSSFWHKEKLPFLPFSETTTTKTIMDPENYDTFFLNLIFQ